MATPRIEGARHSRSASAGGALLGLLLLCAGPAAAEKDLGPVLLSGEVEFGGRLVWGDENNAKFREYRDIRDGLIGSFDLLFDGSEVERFLRARSENTGYRDQRYWLEFGRYGRWKLDFFYGELPYFQSNVSQTPYVKSGKNQWVLPLTPQERIDFADGTLPLSDLPFEPKNIKLKWTEGRIGGEYHLGESTLLRANYRIQDKQGNKAWSMNFGSPGGTFITLPGRVDEQIHEVRVGTDWHLENSSFTIEYLGNFYEDQLTAPECAGAPAAGRPDPRACIIADNPLVAPDPLDPAPDQGRSALPPSNWAQSLLLSGSTRLPIEMPNQIAASFAYGFRYQNDKFLPNTINQDIVDPALPQNSLDGQVQTLLGNLVATAQPLPDLGVKFRYRVYDFDNMTDSILFSPFDECQVDGECWVLNDGAVEENPRASVHNDYLRQNADLDVNWDFAESWTGGLGFGFEGWNRSADREVRDLYEYGPNLNLDYRTLRGTIVHAGYQFRARDGSTYRPFAPIEKGFPNYDCDLDIDEETGQIGVCSAAKFSAVRKFDEANRFLHRLDLLERIPVTQDLELTFTTNFGFSDYDDTSFGLTEGIDWSVGADVFYQIHPRVSLLSYYTYQWQQYEQDSRYRPRGFGGPDITPTDDPDNNWKSRTRYQYHNAEAIARFAVLPETLDLELGYLVQVGRESTHASGEPGGEAPGDAVPYPNVNDLLQAVTATLTWNFREDVTLRAGYRYEDYSYKNFRQGLVPASLVDARNDLYLGNFIRGYHANVFIMSAALRF